MSFQAMTWALRQKTGSCAAKAILLALANYADDEGSCFPGQDRLADECECSVRTVQRWLDYLEGVGLLRRVRRSDGRGARTSDRYFLLLHDNLSPDTSDEPTRQIVGASKDEPTSRTISVKTGARPDASVEALGEVLDEERAEAVAAHRKRIGKPLTPRAASLLASRFAEADDPNAAADEMICNGWQGFKAEWLRGKGSRPSKQSTDDPPKRALEGSRRANSAPSTASRVRISSVTDPALFKLCEAISGKRGLKDQDWCWWFAPEVVERARQELTGASDG